MGMSPVKGMETRDLVRVEYRHDGIQIHPRVQGLSVVKRAKPEVPAFRGESRSLSLSPSLRAPDTPSQKELE